MQFDPSPLDPTPRQNAKTSHVSTINANGAGDAFTAGLLAAMLWPEPLTLHDTLSVALASARQRIDSKVEPRVTADLLRELGVGTGAGVEA